jgi:frataxin
MRRVLQQSAALVRLARTTRYPNVAASGVLRVASLRQHTLFPTAGACAPAMQHHHACHRAAFSTSGPTDEEQELSELTFNTLADDMLHDLELTLDELEPLVDGFDLNNSQGVLTLELGDHGTWVINKQEPNRQIWWSSPLSGPKRFRYDQSKAEWTATRDGVGLHELLATEVHELVGHQLQF